jgi:hypothetical protein
MHNNHNRTIKINKQKLIDKITENKLEHIKDYEEAVVAYKAEAYKQLNKVKEELDGGSLKIRLNLITPVNISQEYDKVLEMFNWEVAEEIEITQREFNEYVHDDNTDSLQAKMLNSTYK